MTTEEEGKTQQQQQQQQQRGGGGQHRGGGQRSRRIADDATFLETIDQTSSVLDLHRSNLLRLQVEELINECRLAGGSTATSSASKKLPSWTTNQLHDFVEELSSSLLAATNLQALRKINPATLVKTCPFVIHNNNKEEIALRLVEGLKKTDNNTKFQVLPFVPPSSSAAGGTGGGVTSALIGRGSCGLTKSSGNANVLPTFDLVLKIPNSLWETKDYKNHKYFDKRNLLVWHVAQTLSNKKTNRSKVGKVFWTLDHNDDRKPTLIVLPPPPVAADSGHNNNNKKRKKNHPSTTLSKNMKKKSKNPKFRIRIRFEMESIDWIPSPLRLIPNRTNLPTTTTTTEKQQTAFEGSPLYNHALLEDAYHSFLPYSSSRNRIKQHHQNSDSEESDSDDSDSDDDDDEYYPYYMDSVILLKIWCLQRGLLRCHDGFTTDHLSLLILYLYRTKRANPRMAPLQVLAVVFKCFLETLWFVHEQQSREKSTTTTTEKASDKNSNNLLRTSPSEQATQYYSSNSHRRRATKVKRSVLIMPSLGRTEAQTIAHSSLAKLYAKQTQESPLTDADPPTLVELYKRDFPGPVFLDSTMRFNYFGRLSPAFMNLVQYEAKRSLNFLNSPTTATPTPSSSSTLAPSSSLPADKPFMALFMNPARFWDRFDLYVKIPLQNIQKQPATNTVRNNFWSKSNQTDWGQWESLTRSIIAVLQQALGNRVQSIRILSTGNGRSSSSSDTNGNGDDADQIPLYEISQKGQSTRPAQSEVLTSSPTGDDCIVLGVSLNVDTCPRVVDRGPPAEQVEAVKSFKDFWGPKAELRRFKDGAIVQAVVWNTTKNEPPTTTSSGVRHSNEDILQGGIVERIIHYILNRHFLATSPPSRKKMILSSPLRSMISVIDGVAMEGDHTTNPPWFSNPTLAHRSVMKAFDGLAAFLREHSLPSLPVPGTLEEKTSLLGIPLPIDAVEPLSPSLRYAELFPPLPHPFLGSQGIKGLKKTAGVIGSDPILIQIRFGASSNWPTDIKAIGAAKTAMLVQLANGIEGMQSTHRHECDGFSGLIAVTPSYLDVGYRGYVFRIQVRADPEIRLLRGLFNPNADASALLRTLTKDHIVSAMHHSMIHAIHTKHASAGGVVRMAMRWISGHMLSGLIPQEAIELLVAKVYTDNSSPLEAPGSVVAGFLRFLHLLESHDWIREPLIVDPHGHIDDQDRSAITQRFEQTRGPSHDGGPPMYIISPNDRQGIEDALSNTGEEEQQSSNQKGEGKGWAPSFTSNFPEWVVLTRTIALARKTRSFLLTRLTTFDDQTSANGDVVASSWSAAFQETSTSYHAYNVLLRVDPDLLVDTGSASTGKELVAITHHHHQSDDHGAAATVLETCYTKSLRERYLGPKKLRLKIYRNMRDQDELDQVCHDFKPVDSLVETLRNKFGSLALFFYNQLCPDVIAILWRPHVVVGGSSSPHPFSAMASEHVKPCVDGNWKADTMMKINTDDILREMSQYWDGIVVKTKLLHVPGGDAGAKQGKSTTKATSSSHGKEPSSSDDDDDEEEEENKKVSRRKNQQKRQRKSKEEEASSSSSSGSGSDSESESEEDD